MKRVKDLLKSNVLATTTLNPCLKSTLSRESQAHSAHGKK